MQQRCAICGTTGESEIRTLTELGFGPDQDGGQLNLCEECLETRTAEDWEPGRQMTARVLSVLQSAGTEHPQGRYSYLRDPDEAVHLVRLQNDWALSHAERET